MNSFISKYIEDAPLEHKKIMEKIRALLHQEVDDLVENFKWSRPVFSTDKDFVYLKSAKNYVSFGIFHFNKIVAHKDLFEGTGVDMRHIKIKSATDIREENIINIIKQIK